MIKKISSFWPCFKGLSHRFVSSNAKGSSKWLVTPVKSYENAYKSVSQIINDFKGKVVIYQWFNNITGESYVGSTVNIGNRLGKYFNPKTLLLPTLIYASLITHGHANFSFAILEVVGELGSVVKAQILAREQHYINMNFSVFGAKCLNILRRAGSSLGYKHSEATRKLLSILAKGRHHTAATISKLRDKFTGELNPFFGQTHSAASISKMSAAKRGSLNPMFGQVKSSAFTAMQSSDSKSGESNPMYKATYVWNVSKKVQEGPFPSKSILKRYHISQSKYSQYLNTGKAYKGFIYSRNSFDNND